MRQESQKFDVFLAGLMLDFEMSNEIVFLFQEFGAKLTFLALAAVESDFVNSPARFGRHFLVTQCTRVDKVVKHDRGQPADLGQNTDSPNFLTPVLHLLYEKVPVDLFLPLTALEMFHSVNLQTLVVSKGLRAEGAFDRLHTDFLHT